MDNFKNSHVIITSSSVFTIDCSPDGIHFVYSNRIDPLRIYNLNTREQVGNDLYGQESSIYTVKYSPHGDFIASGEFGGVVRLWCSESQVLLWSNSGHKATVTGVSFSPNGDHLASSSEDKSILIFNSKDGNMIRKISSRCQVSSLQYSAKGYWLIFCCYDSRVRFWNLQTNKKIKYFRSVKMGFSFKQSKNQKLTVCSGNEGYVKIYESSKLKLTRKHIRKDSKQLNSVTFSNNDQLVTSGDYEHGIITWRVDSGEQIFSLKNHSDLIWTICYSTDDKYILSGSFDNTIRITASIV